MEVISETEALVYGGQNVGLVYVIDLANGGAVTIKSPMNAVGVIDHHASCGSYMEAGDMYAIYAGGQDAA